MFWFLSAHDTAATGLWGLSPSKNDVKHLSCSPGERQFPLPTTLCNLLAELPGRKSLLKFTFFAHHLPEFMKLRRRKRREEERPDSEEATTLKMERFKKNSRGEIK